MAKNKKQPTTSSQDKPTPPTEAELQQAQQQAPLLLSQAIKDLLDDDTEGGIFYAHIIQQMCREFHDKRVPTAAVSVTDKINLYINPWFWCNELKNEKQRAAVLKHEILHLIFHHCTRGLDFGDRQLANIAADLVVNSQINPSIFGEMAKKFVFPSNFKLPHDETLEFYYKNFPIQDNPICRCSGCASCQPTKNNSNSNNSQGDQSQQSQGKQDQDSSGESSSSSGCSEHGDGSQCDHNHKHEEGDCTDEQGKCNHCGGYKSFDFHGVWEEQDGSQVSDAMKESLINDAINRAADAAKDAGNLPNAIKQAISLAKRKPTIPWELILRQFVSKLSAGILYHTKKRISKRFGTRPGPKIKPQLKMLLSVDVSGSITEKEYQAFMNEALAILRNIGSDSIDVLEWDADITSERDGRPGPYKLKKSYQVTRTGCGGTSPVPAIQWINENRQHYDGVIWLTDGHFSGGDLREKLSIPSLWVITADGTTEYVKNRYRTIKLPTESK